MSSFDPDSFLGGSPDGFDPDSFLQESALAPAPVTASASAEFNPDAFLSPKIASPQPTAPTAATPEAKPEEESWDSLRGLETAARQVPQLAYGVAGLVGDTLGIDSMRDWGLRGYKEAEHKMAPLKRENDDVTVAWNKMLEGDVGAMVDWAQYGVGYAVGQFAESAAIAAGGAVIGGMAGAAASAPTAGVAAPVTAPVGAVAGGVSALFAKGAVKAAAKTLVEKALAGQATKIATKQLAKTATAKEIAEHAATQAVQKAAGQRIGMILAAGGNAFGMELGSIYPEAIAQAEKEGRDFTGTDLARTWGAGLAAGAFEGVSDILGIDAVTGVFSKQIGNAVSSILPAGASSLAKRAVGGAVAGSAGIAVEGGTELAQTGIERFGAGKDLTSPEAVNEYINAAALGALGGGVIGGAGGLLSGDSTKPVVDQAATALQSAGLPQIAQAVTAVMGVDNLPSEMTNPSVTPAPVAAPLDIVDSVGTSVPTKAADMASFVEEAFGPSKPEREYNPDLVKPGQIVLQSAPKGFENLDVVWYEDGEGGALPTTRAYNRSTQQFETMAPEAQASVLKAYEKESGLDIGKLKDPANLTRVKASVATAAAAVVPSSPKAPSTPANPLPSGNPEFDAAFPHTDIEFDEDTHVYTMGGVPVPSVTSAKDGNPKFAFDRQAQLASYAKRQGISVAEAEALWDDKRDRGSEFHNNMAKALNDPVAPVSGPIGEVLAAINTGRSGQVVTERPVWGSGYAGTIDTLVPLADGTYRLVDFKTLDPTDSKNADNNPLKDGASPNVNYKGKPSKVDGWRLQLLAYKKALEAKGLTISETMVVPINRATNEPFRDAAGNFMLDATATPEVEALFDEIFSAPAAEPSKNNNQPNQPNGKETSEKASEEANAEGQVLNPGGGTTENVPTPEAVVASTQGAPAAEESKPEPVVTPSSTPELTAEEKKAKREAQAQRGRERNNLPGNKPLGTSTAPTRVPQAPITPSGNLRHRAITEALVTSKVRGKERSFFETTDNPEDFKKLPKVQRFPYAIGATLFGHNDKNEVVSAWVITGKQPIDGPGGQSRIFVEKVDLSNAEKAEANLLPKLALYQPESAVLADSKQLATDIHQAVLNGGFTPRLVAQMKSMIVAQFGLLTNPAFVKDSLNETSDQIYMTAGLTNGKADIRYNAEQFARWAFDRVASVPADNLPGLEFAARDIAETLAQMAFEELGHIASLQALENSDVVGMMLDMLPLLDEPGVYDEVVKHSRWRLGRQSDNMSDDAVVDWFENLAENEEGDAERIAVGHEMLASLLSRISTGKDSSAMDLAFQRYAATLTRGGTNASGLQTLVARIAEMVNRMIEAVATLFGAHRMVRNLPPSVAANLLAMEAMMKENGFKAPDIQQIEQQAIAQRSSDLAGIGRFSKSTLKFSNAQKQVRETLDRIRAESGNPTFMPFMLVRGRLELAPDQPITPEDAKELTEGLAALNDPERDNFVSQMQAAQEDLDMVLRRRNGGRVTSLATTRKNGRPITEVVADLKTFTADAIASLQKAVGEPVADFVDKLNEALMNRRSVAREGRSVRDVDTSIMDVIRSVRIEPEVGRVLGELESAQSAAEDHLVSVPDSDDNARGPWERRHSELDDALVDAREKFNALIQRRSVGDSILARDLRLLLGERRDRVFSDLRFNEINRLVYGHVRSAAELITRFQAHPEEIGDVVKGVAKEPIQAGRIINSLNASGQIMDAASRLRDFSAELNYLLLGGLQPRSISRWSRQWQPLNYTPSQALALTPFQIGPQVLSPVTPALDNSKDRVLNRAPGFSGSFEVPLEIGAMTLSYGETGAYTTLAGELGADGIAVPEGYYGVVLDGMAREVNEGSRNVMRMLGVDPLEGKLWENDGSPLLSSDKVQWLTGNAVAVSFELVDKLSEARWRGTPGVTAEHSITGGFSLEYSEDDRGIKSPVLQEQLFELPDTSSVDFADSSSLIDGGFAGEVMKLAGDFVSNHNANFAGRSNPLLTHAEGMTPPGLVMQLVQPKLMRLLALTKDLVPLPRQGEPQRPALSDSLSKVPGIADLYRSLAKDFEGTSVFRDDREALAKNPFSFQTEFWELYHLMKAGNSVYRSTMKQVRDASSDRLQLAATAAQMPLDPQVLSSMKFRLDGARWWSNYFAQKGATKGVRQSLVTPVRAWPLISQYLDLTNERKTMASEEFDASIQGVERDKLTAGQEFVESEREEETKRRMDGWRSEALGAILGGDMDAILNLVNDQQFSITTTDAQGNPVRGYAEEKIDTYILDQLHLLHKEEQNRGLVFAKGKKGNKVVFDKALINLLKNPANARHRASIRSVTETGGFVQINEGQPELISSESFQSDAHAVFHGVATLIPNLTSVEGNATWEGTQDYAAIPKDEPSKDELTLMPYGARVVQKRIDKAVAKMKALESEMKLAMDAGDKATAEAKGALAGKQKELIAEETKTRNELAGFSIGATRPFAQAPESNVAGARKPTISFVADADTPMVIRPYGPSVPVNERDAREALAAMIEWLGTNGSVNIVAEAQKVVDAIKPSRVSSVELEKAIRDKLTRELQAMKEVRGADLDITPEQDAQIAELSMSWLDAVANGARASAEKMNDPFSIFFTPGQHPEAITPKAAAGILAAALTQPHAKKAIALAMKGHPGGNPATATERAVLGDLLPLSTLPGIDEQIVSDQLGAMPQLQARDGEKRTGGPVNLGDSDFEEVAHITALQRMVEGTGVPYDEDGNFLDELSRMGASPVADIQAQWGAQLLLNAVRGLRPQFADASVQQGDVEDSPFTSKKPEALRQASQGLQGVAVPTRRQISEMEARQLMSVIGQGALGEAIARSGLGGAVGWNGAGAKAITASDLMALSSEVAQKLVDEYHAIVPFERGNTYQEDVALSFGSYSFGDATNYDNSHNLQYYKSRINKGTIYEATKDFPDGISEVGDSGNLLLTADASNLDQVAENRRAEGREVKVKVQREVGGKKLFSFNGREVTEDDVVEVQTNHLAEGLEFLSGESMQDHLHRRTIGWRMRDGSRGKLEPIIDEIPSLDYHRAQHARELAAVQEEAEAMRRDARVKEAELTALKANLDELDKLEPELLKARDQLHMREILGQTDIRLDSGTFADASPILQTSFEDPAHLAAKMADVVVDNWRDSSNAWQRSVSVIRMVSGPERETSRASGATPARLAGPAGEALERISKARLERRKELINQIESAKWQSQKNFDAITRDIIARREAGEVVESPEVLAGDTDIAITEAAAIKPLLEELKVIDRSIAEEAVEKPSLPANVRFTSAQMELNDLAAKAEAELKPLVRTIAAARRKIERLNNLLDFEFDSNQADAGEIKFSNRAVMTDLRDTERELDQSVNQYNAIVERVAARANATLPSMVQQGVFRIGPSGRFDVTHKAFGKLLNRMQGGRLELHRLGVEALARHAAEESQWLDLSGGLSSFDLGPIEPDQRIQIPTHVREDIAKILRGGGIETEMRAQIAETLRGELFPAESRANAAVTALRQKLIEESQKREGNTGNAMEAFRVADQLEEMKKLDPLVRHRITLDVARSILEGRIAAQSTTVQRLVSDTAKHELNYKRRRDMVYASRHEGPTKLQYVGPPENIAILRRDHEELAKRWNNTYMSRVGKSNYLSGLADSIAAATDADRALLDNVAAQAMEAETGVPYEVVTGGIAPVALPQFNPAAVEQPAQRGTKSAMRTDTPTPKTVVGKQEWEVGQSLRSQLLGETRRQLGQLPSGRSSSFTPDSAPGKTTGRLATRIHPHITPNPSSSVGQRIMATLAQTGMPLGAQGPLSAQMGQHDSWQAFSDNVKHQVLVLVATHESKTMMNVAYVDPATQVREEPLHNQIERFLISAEKDLSRANFKELTRLSDEVKRELAADESHTEMIRGFIPSEAMSTGVVRNLVNLDPTVRASMAGSLKGIKQAEIGLGLIQSGDSTTIGRNAWRLQTDVLFRMANEVKSKMKKAGRMENASAGYFFQAVKERLSKGPGDSNAVNRAEEILRAISQAEDGIATALSRGVVARRRGAPSIAKLLTTPLHALRANSSKLIAYFGEETYRMLEERGVARETFAFWEPRLRDIVDNGADFTAVLAQAEKELTADAKMWGEFIHKAFSHEIPIYTAQAEMMGVDVGGQNPWESSPVVPFNWRAFGREYDPADDFPTTRERIEMNRAKWMSPVTRNAKPGEIQMMDINGLTAPLQILEDMIYRRNVAPAYQTFSQVFGVAEHVDKSLELVSASHLERMATDRLGAEEAKAIRGASRFIAVAGQSIIDKDQAERAPRNVMMHLIQVFQQQGAVRALISAKQIWSQTLPGLMAYVGIRDGLMANRDVIGPYVKYLHGLTTAHASSALMGRPDPAVEFARNINTYVRNTMIGVILRTADGNTDYLADVGRDRPSKANRPRGRVTGGLRPLVDATLSPVRMGYELSARASSAMLHGVLAVPESTLSRIIAVHQIVRQLNAGKDPVDHVTIEELVTPGSQASRMVNQQMLQKAETAVTDMMAPSDNSMKAAVHQQRTTAFGELWRGMLSTFANHQLHTSGNSWAGWRMIRFGKDAETRAEGRRLMMSNASQNIIFQIFRYETLGLVTVTALAAMFDWDDEEKEEAYGKWYGITPGMDEGERNRTAMRWVSLIAFGSANPIGYNEKSGEWDDDEKAKDLKQLSLMISKEVVNQTPLGGLGIVASTAAGSSISEYLLKKTVMELIPGDLGHYKRAGLVVPERWGGDGMGPNSESAFQRAIYGSSQVFLNDISSRSTLTGGLTSLVDPVVQIGNSPDAVEFKDAAAFWLSQFPALPRELRRVIQKPAVENTGTVLWDGQAR